MCFQTQNLTLVSSTSPGRNFPPCRHNASCKHRVQYNIQAHTRGVLIGHLCQLLFGYLWCESACRCMLQVPKGPPANEKRTGTKAKSAGDPRIKELCSWFDVSTYWCSLVPGTCGLVLNYFWMVAQFWILRFFKRNVQ